MMDDAGRERLTTTIGVVVGLALIVVVLSVFTAPPAAPSVPDPAAVAPSAAPTRVLAERTTPYFEDEDGRPIAHMTARLVRGPSGVHVEYSASAFGPDIEPPPGYEGVPGSNHTTAREIDALVARGGITLRLEDVDRALGSTLAVQAGTRRRVPQRTVGANGRIDFQGTTTTAYTGSFTGRSKPLADGRYRLFVETDGAVRARCRFVVRDGTATILELAGVDHPLQRDLQRDP